jgi:hypothetical protein
VKHLTVVCLLTICLVGVLLIRAVGAKDSHQTESVTVKPCLNASRIPPIERECVAAAIAEAAFLKATQHKISRYFISSLHPSALRWKIWIIEGDETHPGADGAFWQVYVERSSGKVEIVPGR